MSDYVKRNEERQGFFPPSMIGFMKQFTDSKNTKEKSKKVELQLPKAEKRQNKTRKSGKFGNIKSRK